MVEILRIEAHETRQMRHEVLRPTEAPETLLYPGDDEPTTRHFGAFDGERLIGIASVYAQPRTGPDRGEWRLRGMAVAPDWRCRGVASSLFAAAEEHVRTSGGSSFWCNARVPARAFYERMGLTAKSDVFELPGIGPHVVMEKPVRQDD